MKQQALGVLEFRSIPCAVSATDAALKSGQVRLLDAYTVCPGKFLAILAGETGALEHAVGIGVKTGEGSVVNSHVFSTLRPDVFPAITGTVSVPDLEACGIIETFTVTAAIRSADLMAKEAAVTIAEIRLARGLGGKAFVLFSGSFSAVESGLKAAVEAVGAEGELAGSAVIPALSPELWAKLL